MKKQLLSMLFFLCIVHHVACSQKSFNDIALGMVCATTMVSLCETMNEVTYPISIDTAWMIAPMVLLGCCSENASIKNRILCTASGLCSLINIFRIGFRNNDRDREKNKKDIMITSLSAAVYGASAQATIYEETIEQNREIIRALRQQVSILQPQARQDLMRILQNIVVAREISQREISQREISQREFPEGYRGAQTM
ncbi:MAG TPA: hypothetical protein VLG50_04535 [Candidatus Saccharimonadales bacterium]|nr:hypothetical protein [Candidatus Saccharimonadales bacterium]